jgi:hypothetical protein
MPKINIKMSDNIYLFESTPPTAQSDFSVHDWALIFLSFMSEHVRHYPHDAPYLPRYMEIILVMAQKGYDWRSFDENFRMARSKAAKKMILHRSRFGKWHERDMDTYQDCAPAQDTRHISTFQPKLQSQQSRKNESFRLPNTCWKFQEGRCYGDCPWPTTHYCYLCKGPHPTSEHRSGHQEGPKASTEKGKELEPVRHSHNSRDSRRSRDRSVRRR